MLRWEGEPIHAVYHATNGGISASGEEAWAMDPLPYVRVQLDGSQAWRDSTMLPLQSSEGVKALLQRRDGAYGSGHPRFRWTRTYSAGQLAQALAAAGKGNALPSAVSVKDRGPSGRVLSLLIERDGGASPVVLRLDAIRRTLRRLPSTLFVLQPDGPDVWQFQGGGFGHGVGLSQAGAIDLAGRGWNAQRILQHYYPGTLLEPLRQKPATPSVQAP